MRCCGPTGPAGTAASFCSVRGLLSTPAPPPVALLGQASVEALELLLEAGLDLLLEPPLARAPETADRLEARAERAGRLVWTFAPARHAHALQRSAAAIRGGSIGELRWVEANLATKPLSTTRPGAPLTLDAAISGLDAVEALGGEIQRLRVTSPTTLEARLRGDARARVLLVADPRLPLVRAVGERGEIAVGVTRTRLVRDGEPNTLAPGYDAFDARVAQLERFLRARATGSFTGDAGAQTVAWLHAAARSRVTQRFEWA